MRGGDGPPLLFLHGAGGASDWAQFMDRLAARFEMIVPSHPGFGRPDTPDWLDSMSDLAFFYLDLQDALDPGEIHAVGNSLGGWLACEIAVRDANRFRTLSLVAPAGIEIAGVPKDEILLWKPDERVRNTFFDQALAEQRLAATPGEEAADIALKNLLHHRAARLAPAALQPGPAQVAAPDRCADDDPVGRRGQDHPAALCQGVPGPHPRFPAPRDRGMRAPAPSREDRDVRGRRRGQRRKQRIVKFYFRHLMPYGHLDLDYDASCEVAFLTLPNSYYDPELGHRLYHRYLDELELADALGFDGVCVNEHHQTAYGMTPAPNVLAGALSRSIKNSKVCVLGRALPITDNPLSIAEECAGSGPSITPRWPTHPSAMPGSKRRTT